MHIRFSLSALCVVFAVVIAVSAAAKPGEYGKIGDDDWRDATLMMGMEGFLWIIDDGTLYRVATK